MNTRKKILEIQKGLTKSNYKTHFLFNKENQKIKKIKRKKEKKMLSS